MVVLALLLSVPLSGCVDAEPEPAVIQVAAKDGSRYTGWDYGGHSRTGVDAQLAASLDPVRDHAALNVSGAWAIVGSARTDPFRIVFIVGNGTDPVRADVDEPGWNGTAGQRLPTLPLRVVADGSAALTIDGTPLTDPYTDATQWAARFFVTESGVRDVVASEVLAEGRMETYDPATPERFTAGDDLEAVLLLTSPVGQDLPTTRTNESRTVPGGGSDNVSFLVPSREAIVRVVVEVADDPTAVGPYSVRVLDPDGGHVARRAVGALQQNRVATFEFGSRTMGLFEVVVDSTSTAAAYTIDIEVAPPPLPTWWFHWESPRIQE
ncbi:MAG: hypothetical protein KY455_08165 [Euryarchaeota archaeon]|nr:hypothetical protein [Euryarchaeota archaeon]